MHLLGHVGLSLNDWAHQVHLLATLGHFLGDFGLDDLVLVDPASLHTKDSPHNEASLQVFSCAMSFLYFALGLSSRNSAGLGSSAGVSILSAYSTTMVLRSSGQ